jgi:hypothetical protein
VAAASQGTTPHASFTLQQVLVKVSSIRPERPYKHHVMAPHFLGAIPKRLGNWPGFSTRVTLTF